MVWQIFRWSSWSKACQKTKRRLAIALALNTVVFIVELVGGRYANSDPVL